MEGMGEKELEKEDEVEVKNPEPRPQLHKSPNPYVPPIPFLRSSKNLKLEKSHQNIYDSLSCPIGSHNCNTVDITFNRGGESVKFNGNRSKDRREDDCLVLKVPKSIKKNSQVVDLMQALVMVTEMKEGNHGCLLEQEAIKLEDEKLAKRTLMSGRTRQSAKQVGQGSERRTRRAPRVSPCVRHPDFKDLMEYFQRHDIVVERGIVVQELEDTPIPQVVERRGWETFTSPLPIYCRKVVEEFYSGMVPEYFQQHGSVVVRGV
ncbi:hypothetical protein LWI29_009689 [Acer saccharum]|uniref:Uncharacterized protein n=1 Tax=Acer saccharum TaxID=4024 RepID=A0AA39RE08_ACESA|nr:hypothetical protein LWI29_009689 [Acer saccharum]